MNKAKCSQAGRALAECRWGKGKGKKKAAPKKAPKKKAAAPPRRSRRLAGKTPVRGPEPAKKPRIAFRSLL